MALKKTLLFFIFIPLLSFSLHKYYISLTDVTFKEETQSVQIVINVFMDDIELALNNINAIDLQLTTKKELPKNDVYFKQYLEKNLHFTINNTPKKFNYLGKEYDGNLVFFYLEIEDISSLKTIEITNTILVNQFAKQQNMIKVKVGKQHKSALLSKRNDKALLKF